MCKVRGENKQSHYIYIYILKHTYIYIYIHMSICMFSKLFSNSSHEFTSCFSYVGLIITYLYLV